MITNIFISEESWPFVSIYHSKSLCISCIAFQICIWVYVAPRYAVPEDKGAQWKFPGGYSDPYGAVFSLIQNQTDDFCSPFAFSDAKHCNRLR